MLLVRSLLLHCLTVAATASFAASTVNVDCSSAVPFNAFWRSCGYTPAEFALRSDEIENMAWTGAAPSRGVKQIRMHFLLDLLIVTSFVPDAAKPSGWGLSYDWILLDAAIDWLVLNRLSPGFEIMGSPLGFPALPSSTYQASNGNGAIEPDQTLNMTRTLVADLILHAAQRYGAAEVATWNFETWNEPSCGWGWPRGANLTAAAFAGYTNLWDASAAGVADAETVLGIALTFGGPAACTGVESAFLQWAVAHYVSGTNVYTGAPGRLDFISSHYKGGGSAAGTVTGAQGLFAWLRATYPTNPRGLWAVPFFNDEADPVVGWAKPLEWRGDARYGATLAKELTQHLLALQDAGTRVANPMGLISWDAGFMNEDGYTGWAQRTLLARFNGANSSGGSPGLPGAPFAFVRKSGLLLFSLLSKLGSTVAGGPPGAQPQRCALTGGGAASNVTALVAPFGGVATVTAAPADGVNAAQAAVMLYNSADAANATGPSDTVTVGLSMTGLPFPAGAAVAGVHWRLDNNGGGGGAAGATDPAALWVAQGSPATPSPVQLQALWAAGRLTLLFNGSFAVGAGGTLAVPPFDLPLPGVSVWHFASAPPGPPPAPSGLRAYMKDPSMSLLDAASQREVLVRWDCAGPVAGLTAGSVAGLAPGAAAAPVISSATASFLVQASSGGAGGPWVTVAGDPRLPQQFADFGCAAVHAAAGAAPALWYRVAALDYWGVQGVWAAPVASGPWPVGPADALGLARDAAAARPAPQR